MLVTSKGLTAPQGETDAAGWGAAGAAGSTSRPRTDTDTLPPGRGAEAASRGPSAAGEAEPFLAEPAAGMLEPCARAPPGEDASRQAWEAEQATQQAPCCALAGALLPGLRGRDFTQRWESKS